MRDAQAGVPSAGRPRAQLAFKDSMVHGILQFTPSIAFRYVLHRCKSLDIRCRESYDNVQRSLPRRKGKGARPSGHICSLAHAAPGVRYPVPPPYVQHKVAPQGEGRVSGRPSLPDNPGGIRLQVHGLSVGYRQ